MTDQQIEERKKYLALQAFYIKVRKLIDELEKKLNPEPEESSQ